MSTNTKVESTDAPVPGKQFLDGTQKPDRFTDLYRLLPKDKRILIFDVGANVGDMSKKFKDMFPLSTIHDFEPTPDAFKRLKWRFKQEPSVILNNAAVAETGGTRRFYVNEEFNKVNSLLQRNKELSKYYRYDVKNYIDVKTISIDQYCNENKIKKVNLLKLDIQGGEIYALRGAVEMLQQQRIDVILSEILFIELYEGGAVFHEISEYLSQYGYSLYHLYDLHRADEGQLTWGDGIFLSHNYRSKVLGKKRNLVEKLIAQF